MTQPNLTANDIALSSFGVIHMLNFHRAQKKTAWTNKQIVECQALLDKLNAASDAAIPFENSDDMPSDWGGHDIYVPAPDASPICEGKDDA